MLLKINLCGDKDELFEFKEHQEIRRMALLASHRTTHLDIPYSRSNFYNFHRNKVFNIFVFFYPSGSVQAPDAKRTQRLGPGMLA